MGLSKRHRWTEAGEGVFENGIGRIRRVVVGVVPLYYTTIDLRAKAENQITCGPFLSSGAAEEQYESLMAAAAGTKTDFSRGRSGL